MDDMERRQMARYYLVSRADVLVRNSFDPIWGGVANVSRTGVTLYVQQPLKLRAKVTLTFHFCEEDGWGKIETATAAIIWQSGDAVGFKFERPILANSLAAKKTPYLADYIAGREADALDE
jgi:hypothetical protein